LKLPQVFLKALTIIAILLSVFFTSYAANAADKENCLMCHKYRQIGRIDEAGRQRSYFVDEKIYANTTHRNVPCRDCHNYITNIPHDTVKEEVNCANECHIKPPFSKENFSHKKIIDVYNRSVHGVKEDDTDELKKAKPYCKYCHVNPLFTNVDEKRISFEKSLSRCINCHERKGVTQAYKHMAHRLRQKTSRSTQEIVQMCSKNCHADLVLMSKFKVSKESLEAVETYNESIHGKAVALGSQDAADCVSCHATSAIHDIYKKDEKHSTVNPINRINTCEQCHKNVNDRFVQIDVHSGIERHEKPVLYFTNLALTFVFYGSVFGLIGLALLETVGRRRDGIKWQIKRDTTWRGTPKPRKK
jgi:hypothetical protein